MMKFNLVPHLRAVPTPPDGEGPLMRWYAGAFGPLLSTEAWFRSVGSSRVREGINRKH